LTSLADLKTGPQVHCRYTCVQANSSKVGYVGVCSVQW